MCWLSFLSICMKRNTKLLKFFKVFFISLKRHLWYHPLYFWISGLAGNKPEYLPLFQNQHSSLKVPLNTSFHGSSSWPFPQSSERQPRASWIPPAASSSLTGGCFLSAASCHLSLALHSLSSLCNHPPWIPSWGPASWALRPLFLHQLHQGWLTAICIFKQNCCPHPSPTDSHVVSLGLSPCSSKPYLYF